MRLSLSTVHWSPMFGAPQNVERVLDSAAAAGWRNIGLDVPSVEAYVESGGTIDGLRSRLDSLGLSCSDVLVLAITADVREVDRHARRLAELAGTFGASTCAVAFPDGSAALDPDDPRAGWALTRCADVFNDTGCRLALEFLPYSPVCSLGVALQLCQMVGFERVGLLVDSWHLLMNGSNNDLAGVNPAELAFVQFSDAPWSLRPGLGVAEASRRCRLLPGTGRFDLRSFVDHIKNSGYNGVVAPEVLSEDLRALPLDVATSSLLDTSRKLWGPLP